MSFEMLRLMPDFETSRLTHDFQTFQNHASDVIFCDYASDVQNESGYVDVTLCDSSAIWVKVTFLIEGQGVFFTQQRQVQVTPFPCVNLSCIR